LPFPNHGGAVSPVFFGTVRPCFPECVFIINFFLFQQIVITRRVWVSGSCACFVLIIACFVPFLWPLLFFLCTPRFKDAHHHCPYCMTLLSIKRR
uniref:LITAF domain-containing protein n=1 Tax=Haemonchus placei TaxID=6290 RepID=A0A158QQQ9_HAEPC